VTHTPAEVVCQLVVDLGLAGDGGAAPVPVWPAFSTGLPDKPDDAVGVTDTAGSDDGRTMTDGEVMGLAGVQVMVRSARPRAGWAKLSEVYDALSQTVRRATVTIGAASYMVHSVSKFGDPLPLGRESPTSARRLFSFNAVVYVTEL
jgi:hypothetical protein